MGKSLDEAIFRWPRVLEDMEEARVTGNLSYFDRSVYWRVVCRLKECMEFQRFIINPHILAQRESVREMRRSLGRAYYAIHDNCRSIADLVATKDICDEICDELDMLDAWLDLVDNYCIGDLGWESLNHFIRIYHSED